MTAEAADQDLRVARLQGRDALAWDAVLRENTGRLLRVARRITSNDAEAEEAVQDGFLAAYRGIGGFDARSTIATWLHRIVVRAALARLRGQRRRQETPME